MFMSEQRFSERLPISSSLTLKFPNEADVLLYFNFLCHLAALQIHGLVQTYTSKKKPQKIHEAASENYEAASQIHKLASKIHETDT